MHWVGIYINYKTKGQVLETKKIFLLLLSFLGCFPKNQLPKGEAWDSKASAYLIGGFLGAGTVLSGACQGRCTDSIL